MAERAGIEESALECRNRIRVPSTTELNRWQTERQTDRGRKRQQDGEKERERDIIVEPPAIATTMEKDRER